MPVRDYLLVNRTGLVGIACRAVCLGLINESVIGLFCELLYLHDVLSDGLGLGGIGVFTAEGVEARDGISEFQVVDTLLGSHDGFLPLHFRHLNLLFAEVQAPHCFSRDLLLQCIREERAYHFVSPDGALNVVGIHTFIGLGFSEPTRYTSGFLIGFWFFRCWFADGRSFPRRDDRRPGNLLCLAIIEQEKGRNDQPGGQQRQPPHTG